MRISVSCGKENGLVKNWSMPDSKASLRAVADAIPVSAMTGTLRNELLASYSRNRMVAVIPSILGIEMSDLVNKVS